MQKSSTVAVINGEKKILLLKRGSTAPYSPDKYCLPGGMVDKNESLKHTGTRELYEETGISCAEKDLCEFTIFYTRDYSKVIFLLSLDSPTVSLSWEHSDYVWVDSKNFLNYDLVPRLAATIGRLISCGIVC